MILRKPYAFLIKSFKIIHILFTLFGIFAFYKTSTLLGFLNEYISNDGFIIEAFKANSLLSFMIIFSIFVFILLNLVVFLLMLFKKKNTLFYIFNIVFYGSVLVFLIIVMSTLGTMQIQIVDTRVVRALRDICLVIDAISIVSIFMYGMRSFGFDIKKFNFGKDLVNLKIEEKDSEEVEVEFNFDTNKAKRNRRKIQRQLKYFYFEHKIVCNILISLFGLFIVFLVLRGTLNSMPNYNQFEAFNTQNYNTVIEEAYITNVDKDGKQIDGGNYFFIMEVKVKKLQDTKILLNTSRFKLLINGNAYYHQYLYKDYFSDMGSAYISEELTKDYQTFILIYKINDYINGANYVLDYEDTFYHNKVKINPSVLNEVSNYTFEMNQELKFSSILEEYTLSIKSFELNEKIAVNYSFCWTSSNCLKSIEYIYPTISENYDKALIRIDYLFTLPEEYNKYIPTISSFLKNFGYLKYTVDGVESTFYFNTLLQAKKVNQPNTIYAEIKKEILSASKIVLGFRIRNEVYETVLRGEAE